VVTLVFGGTFDPPHAGHERLLESAKRHFGVERALVLVVAEPGHREVVASAEDRLELARAAFPGEDVELDRQARTIDMLRARQLEDPVLVIGSDEYLDFARWKEPDAILELASVAVAARPGYELPEGVVPFEMKPTAVSSTEIRDRVARGEPIDDLVAPAVAAEIERLGLYRD
jgi:nicotinate-nucleotide adenylyltransferase